MKNNQTQKNFILGIKISFFHPQLSPHPKYFSPSIHIPIPLTSPPYFLFFFPLFSLFLSTSSFSTLFSLFYFLHYPSIFLHSIFVNFLPINFYNCFYRLTNPLWLIFCTLFNIISGAKLLHPLFSVLL